MFKRDPPLFGSKLCSEDGLFKVKRQKSFNKEPRGWKGCHSKKPSVDEVHTPSQSSLDTSPALSDTEQERKPHECCPHGSIPNTNIKHSDTGVTPSVEVGLEVPLKPNATKSWISYHTIRKEDHQLVFKRDPPLFGSKLCSEDGLFKVKRQKSFNKENQGGGKAATAKSPQLMRSTRPATAA